MYLVTTLVFLLSTTVGLISCTDAQSANTVESPAQVVRQYVSFARAGELDKLKALTVLDPKYSEEARGKITVDNKKQPPNSNSGSFIVTPDPAVAGNGGLDWIRSEFPGFIKDQNKSIKTIESESIDGSEARVQVIFGNEERTFLLPYVFRLTRVEEKWRIYDISTAGASEPSGKSSTGNP